MISLFSFLILITEESRTLSGYVTFLADFPCRSRCVILLTFEEDRDIMLLSCCLEGHCSMLGGRAISYIVIERDQRMKKSV